KFLFLSVIAAVAVTILSAMLTPYFDLSRNPFIQEIMNIRKAALTFYFLYSTVASIFVPIPTMPLEVLFAGLFGIPMTLIVRLGASLVGATFAFFISHRYGRPLLKKLLPASTYQDIEKFSNSHGIRAFFLIAIFPLVNPEVMAYVAGLGNLRLTSTLLVLLVANLYRFLVAMVWGRQILQNLGL
ncbi:MAG: VTT domain-containing protein, partial [Candidatus Paceibacteria bacterium]